MIEWKVSGKFENQERFSIVVKAFDTWHAMNVARKIMSNRIVAMSAFKN